MTGPVRSMAGARNSDPDRKGRSGALKWLWCSLAVIALDQFTKFVAVRLIDPAAPVEVLPNLDLVLVYNAGAAFSILSTAGGWQRWMFIGFAVAVCAFIVYWLRELPPGARQTALALSLIFGGAVGNAIDRVRIGAVLDFIDFHVSGWHWPAFNTADAAICVGAVLLVLGTFRRETP